MSLGASKVAMLGAAGVTEDVVLLATANASGSASLEFTSGVTSSYGEYIFKFYNIHPASDGASGFQFQVSIDGGSNYNVVCTSTFWRINHMENDSAQEYEYNGGYDLAQGTGYQTLETNVGNDNDQSCSGELHLINPGSTTYVKHFYGQVSTVQSNDSMSSAFAAGFFNTTSAVNAISFKMGSGNIDAGEIKMWGVK